MRILTTSSMISLMAETLRMKIKGTSVVYRPVGDTSGICCIKAMNKKKMLAQRRNCSKRNMGMKLKTLYFPVEMRLLQYFCGCGRLMKMMRCSASGRPASVIPSIIPEPAPSSSSGTRNTGMVKHKPRYILNINSNTERLFVPLGTIKSQFVKSKRGRVITIHNSYFLFSKYHLLKHSILLNTFPKQ